MAQEELRSTLQADSNACLFYDADTTDLVRILIFWRKIFTKDANVTLYYRNVGTWRHISELMTLQRQPKPSHMYVSRTKHQNY
jgi:hypothetical protein